MKISRQNNKEILTHIFYESILKSYISNYDITIHVIKYNNLINRK